jgi:hypothetical protein
MLDFNNSKSRIKIIDQEDRALLRSNPSAWSMPEDGKEHIFYHMLLSSPSSFGSKAKNLLSWCEAPNLIFLPKNKYFFINIGLSFLTYEAVSQL